MAAMQPENGASSNKKRKQPPLAGSAAREFKRRSLQEQRKALPIASAAEKLVEEVKKHSTLIVIGETGSGKTTQLPQYLHAAGMTAGGQVGVTQPRRVAAVTVATRVAEEMGAGVGQEVGYTVRFEDVTSARTRIKYMTDGMLLREALLDPLLQRYAVIVVDEAHERTVSTDVLFGLLKQVQRRRQEAATGGGGNCRREKEGGAGASGEGRRGTDAHRGKRARLVDPGEAGSGREQREPQEDRKDKEGGQVALTNGSPGSPTGNGATGRGGKQGGKGGGEGASLQPLKLVVMSATLEAERFSAYFGGAPAVYIRGRQYPVEVLYTPTPEADYLDAALTTVLQVHLEEGPGAILVFLTGQEEIEAMERLLTERARRLPAGSAPLAIAPIFAALPSEQQLRVFQPAPEGTRKVVLATNIAETSVTIPGIRYVVDPGLVKARAFNPRVGVEALLVVPVSQAQARQRSGRAGREGPGKCFRLYPEAAFEALDAATVPEIRRCNPASTVLQLKALGVDDILGFDFMDKPPRAAIVKALEHLYILGALTSEGQLSAPLGLQMARFPLEPLFSKALLVASQWGCAEEMVAVVALLSVGAVFFSPREKQTEAKAAKKRFTSPEGDHLTLINVFRAYREEASRKGATKAEARVRSWCHANFINARALRKALEVYRQIRGYCEGMALPLGSCGDDFTGFRRCLAAAFFLNAAQRQPDNTYRALASGQTVAIHPSSVMSGKKPDCVVFNELVRTNRQYIRDVTQIDSQWLTEVAPQYYRIQETRANCSSGL